MLIYDIALTLIPEIGHARGRRLIEVFGSAELALKTAPEDIAEQTEIPLTAIQNMQAARVYPTAEAEIRYMERHGIQAITFSDPRYPERLKECNDAPLILYTRGEIDFNTPWWLSIVGTRKITAYGKKMTAKLVDGLAEQMPEAVIVSGLAYGTDIEAHLAALRGGMKTVAVLGNPLGSVYPEAHTGYAQQIVDKGGAIVSEFHSLHPVAGSNFLRRNRIIAGLSSGTLVIESAFKGGSLSTAACAVGYYRDVMAVPGRVGDPMSEGTNRLIRDQRAALVITPQDILDHLNWDGRPSPKRSSRKSEATDFPAPEAIPLALDGDEERIYRLLREGTPLPVDELTEKTSLSAARISALSLGMEIKGLIRRLPGNRLEKV